MIRRATLFFFRQFKELLQKFQVILPFPVFLPPLIPVYVRSRKSFSRTIFFLLFILMVGCAGNRPQPPVPQEVVRFSYPAAEQELSAPLPEYQIGYNDLLEVKFFNHPEFNETVRVRPDGRITLQKIGDLFVMGKTPEQLRDTVLQVYRKILKNPDITVFVREFGAISFYVLGSVKVPGSHKYEKNLTVLQAIAMAGGFDRGAHVNNIYLIRKGSGGDFFVYRLNLALNDVKQALAQNLIVQPYDLIYVPKTTFASTMDFLKQLWEGVLPPLDLYLRTIYLYRHGSYIPKF